MNNDELIWTKGTCPEFFSSFGHWQIWGLHSFFLGLHATDKKKLLRKKVNFNCCSKLCLWNFIITPKSQRRASVVERVQGNLSFMRYNAKENYDCKQKAKFTFQLDIKFIHYQLFSFFLADLQWRHLSANKSTLWWHSGLSRPGEDSTLLCNISLLSSFLVIQTVGNWKTEGWHQIEVQQNQAKSSMRVLFVNSLNKSKSMVRVFRVLFRVEYMVWSGLAWSVLKS